MSYSANAQLTLTGSSYTQNFDGLSTIPTGWSTYNNASVAGKGSIPALGNAEALQSTFPAPPSYNPMDSSCIGNVKVGGFKNFPSATVATAGDNNCSSTGPSTTLTNRAYGVRQVDSANGTHPDLDPGASFVLKIANTNGLRNFNLSFKLQSLDTNSARTTTWTVDYGFGSSPASFTPVTTTGIMTTGNHLFSNNTVTANFGNALDNKSGIVIIRISALAYSSGSGNRASSAIDDFNLTWTNTVGISEVSENAQANLYVLGSATSDEINFEYSVAESESYNFTIYDLSGRVLHSRYFDAKAGTQQISVDGLHLVPGMYFARMNNSNNSTVAKIIVQ